MAKVELRIIRAIANLPYCAVIPPLQVENLCGRLQPNFEYCDRGRSGQSHAANGASRSASL